ncbi:hypothetical protein FHT21_002076 [Pedobacter sp. SG908]|nr:hypothetical protein [Pedobacter sp. SG908]NMN37049.1 hypothetical protein [Pedobacter sp. SG918]
MLLIVSYTQNKLASFSVLKEYLYISMTKMPAKFFFLKIEQF